jgi:hypothetical protein
MEAFRERFLVKNDLNLNLLMLTFLCRQPAVFVNWNTTANPNV